MRFIVSNSELQREDNESVVAGSFLSTTATFSLSGNWTKAQNICAIFKRSENSLLVELSENKVIVPFEMLGSIGQFELSLEGYGENGEILKSKIIKITVEEGHKSPIGEKLIFIEKVGPQGVKGDKGEQGIQGVKGDKGEPGVSANSAIEPYSSTRTYGANELCTYGGGIWRSRIVGNIGNAPGNGTIRQWQPDKLYSSISLYVDGVNGSNTTGDGTKTKPFKTIQFAIDLLPTVTIANGSDIGATISISSYISTDDIYVRGFLYPVTFSLLSDVEIRRLFLYYSTYFRINPNAFTFKVDCKDITLIAISAFRCGNVALNGTIAISNSLIGVSAEGGNVTLSGNGNFNFENVSFAFKSAVGCEIVSGRFVSITGGQVKTLFYSSAGTIRLSPTITASYTTKIYKEYGGQVLTSAGIDME